MEDAPEQSEEGAQLRSVWSRPAPEQEGEVVRIADLSIRPTGGGSPVVNRATLAIKPGKVVGLVGESGSGKTTLALAVCGRIRPGLIAECGSIHVRGLDVLRASKGEVRALRGKVVAYVPQDPLSSLNPGRTLGFQVDEALRVHGFSVEVRKARIEELLDEVGLHDVPNVLGRYPHQLSGGQQQRVAIAIAFACRPAVLVMDEPTTGLDVIVQRRVLTSVRSMIERYNATVVYISHDLAVVNSLADELAVMYRGRIVEAGTAEAVIKAPAHPYTEALVAAVPRLRAAWRPVDLRRDRARRERVVRDSLVELDGKDQGEGCGYARRCPKVQVACLEEVDQVVLPGGQRVRCRFPLHPSVGSAVEQRDEREAEALPAQESSRSYSTALPAAREVLERQAHDGNSLEIHVEQASYGNKVVLQDVHVVVKKGEWFGVVGESGSGKTTLARVLVGLHRSWRGRLRYEGREMLPGESRTAEGMVRRFQYVFQNPYASLNPRRCVEDIVSWPLLYFESVSRAVARERVLETLTDVGLDEKYLVRYPDELSGGERQRVAVARALIVDPEVLVCDEITSALDVSVQASLVETLAELRAKKKLTLVFVTHNIALLRSFGTRGVVMKDGRVVEGDTIARIIDAPKAAYTRRLIDAVVSL